MNPISVIQIFIHLVKQIPVYADTKSVKEIKQIPPIHSHVMCL